MKPFDNGPEYPKLPIKPLAMRMFQWRGYTQSRWLSFRLDPNFVRLISFCVSTPSRLLRFKDSCCVNDPEVNDVLFVV